MKHTLFTLVLVLATAAFAFGQTTEKETTPGGKAKAADRRQSEEQNIHQLINDLAAAFERNDAAALDRLYADDFIGTTLAGELYDKPALLGVIKSGIQKYESVNVDEIKIHVYGDAATVHSRGRIKLQVNGQHKEDLTRDTTTLVKRQGQWRIVADHASPIAKQ